MGHNPLDYVGSKYVNVEILRAIQDRLPLRNKVALVTLDKIEDQYTKQLKPTTVLWTEKKLRGDDDAKGYTLNATNVHRIVDAWGVDTDGYVGREFDVDIDETVKNPRTGAKGGVRITPVGAVVRVAPPPLAKPVQGNGNTYAEASQPAQPATAPQSPPQGGAAFDLDDEIPFAPEWRG